MTPAESQRRVWSAVCAQINDAALSPLVSSLRDHRVADTLLAKPAGVCIRDLAILHGLRHGPLLLAARVFELCGLAVRERADDPSHTIWHPTDRGRKVLAGSAHPSPPADGSGEAVAAAMARLFRGGVDPAHLDNPLAALGWQDELESLAAAGWAERDGGLWRATAAGRIAIAMAPQFLYVDGYRPLFAHIAALLRDNGAYRLPRDASDGEAHVDRAADVAFSGLVFARTCRTAFLDLSLPLFEGPLARQPAAVVDTGAGDGTLLAELFHAIRRNTTRGARLADRPLTMVVVEPSPVARAIAAERLAAADVPHVALDGDIGTPGTLVEALANQGIAMDDALHVSKSVIHNRSVPGDACPAIQDPAFSGSLAVHLDHHAGPMTSLAMAGDLIAWFRQWRPWCARHGMVAVEAHVADPAAVFRAGPTPIPATELSHGLSLQHLVEPAFHRRASALAGYETLGARDLQAGLVGQPLMTCDHIRPV